MMTISNDLLSKAKRQALDALMKHNSQANAQSVRCDLVPWYDTYMFNWVNDHNFVPAPPVDWSINIPISQSIKFFSNTGQFQFNAGATTYTIPDNKKWRNHELSDGVMNSQSSYGIIAFYYQFHPYPGAAFENWFINRVIPMFKAQVGKRDTKRWQQRMGYLSNFRPVDMSAQAQYFVNGAPILNGTGIGTNHFGIPTSVLEEPWIIEPKDQCMLELSLEGIEAGTQIFYDANVPYELAKYFHSPAYANAGRIVGNTYIMAISLGLIGVWCTVS